MLNIKETKMQTAKMALAMKIWSKTHTDYRTEKGMLSHPGILRNGDNGTYLQPLMLLSDEQLALIATAKCIR